MRQHELVDVFRDTMKQCDGRTSVGKSIILVKPQAPNCLETFDAKVIVNSLDTITQALHCNQKSAILNFASAIRPGGLVDFGTNTQEDCLCRCTSLYYCLNNKEMVDNFYSPHKQLSDLANDDIIYTTDVVILKDNNYQNVEHKLVDVITCAAPNIQEGRLPNNLQELLNNRVDCIFKSAIGKVKILILGAWGCGAFMNPYDLVANAFKRSINLYGKYFQEIYFPIYKDIECEKVFKKILENEEMYDG